jgi:hypothetical protein
VTGKVLVVVGVVIAAVGIVLWQFPRAFSWFGHLPGDIRIERDGTRIYVPIGLMVVVSVGLTLIVNAIVRLVELWS